MLNSQRLEFVTRHFGDLQTIRLAPVPVAMLLVPLAHRLPHVSVARALVLGFLFGVVGFYWWSTVAIKRRYGSVKLSRDEVQRMLFHPAIFALTMIMAAVLSWFYFFAPHTHYWDVYYVFSISIIMLRTILDSTNPIRRRGVWATGLVALFTAGPSLVAGGGVIALAGAVWLSISIFDFLLLRRTLAEISASPPTAATEAVARHG